MHGSMLSKCLIAILSVSCGFAAETLTKSTAQEAVARIAAERLAVLKKERSGEVEARSITLGDKTLRWLQKDFGSAPVGKRSLWISMHGGGNAPPAVNDQQWKNQIRLYQPAEGIYLAPRAPTDTWNLWHEAHIDPLFGRLIEDMIAVNGVDPDKVYLMGYSAGGDGVWQLAPRMADRFAAAAMMAGHPNEAKLDGLRNLPFALFVGGADAMYERNKIVKQRIDTLDQMAKDDPGGYVHLGRVYEGLPHWMNGKDAEAVPWMAAFTRSPWPKKIVWLQDDVTHDRFYWLEIPKGSAKASARIVAEVNGQDIKLSGDVPPGISVLLSDSLVDLDQAITISVNGKPGFQGKVTRSEATIREAIEARPEITSCPTAIVRIK
jgi:pimeloyl-ACP methyl ester carboxylesterase